MPKEISKWPRRNGLSVRKRQKANVHRHWPSASDTANRIAPGPAPFTSNHGSLTCASAHAQSLGISPASEAVTPLTNPQAGTYGTLNEQDTPNPASRSTTISKEPENSSLAIDFSMPVTIEYDSSDEEGIRWR
jgi:hypothetical protein